MNVSFGIKHLVAKIMLRLARVGALRSIFLLLPMRLRIVARSFVSGRGGQEPLVNHGKFSRIAKEIALSSDSQHSSHDTVLQWTTVGFSRSIGAGALEDVGALSENPVEILTIDFWDTIIARIRPAEGAKRLTALRISLAHWLENGHLGERIMSRKLHWKRVDIESWQQRRLGEAKVAEVLSELLDGETPGLSSADYFVATELEDEKKYSKPLVPVSTLTSRVKSNQVSVVSDFYMSGAALREIYETHNPDVEISAFYSSSDFGLTKREKGALFKKLGLASNPSWTHIGDSDYSDLSMAQKHGATAFKLERIGETSWNGHEIDESKLVRDIREHLSTDDGGRYLLDVCLTGVALVTFAVEQALSAGKKQVVYVSREGETLLKIHEALEGQLADLGIPKLEAIHLPCSRASVFFPSYWPDLQGGFEELARQHPVITADAAISTLCLPLELAELVSSQIGKLQRVRTARFLQLLDPSTVAHINHFVQEQRSLLLELLTQLGISPDESLVCDIGWRGTINNSLNRITQKEIPGAYLGLHTPLAEGAKPDSKRGLIFDENQKEPAPDHMLLLGPVERAFTLSGASVIRYARNEGQVELVLSEDKDEPTRGRKEFVIDNLQKSATMAADLLFSIGLFGIETKEFTKEIVSRWMTNPNSFHASTWFDENHTEGFGVKGDIHYGKPLPSSAWFEANGHKLVEKAIRESLWPEGYLAWQPVQRLRNI